MTRFQRIVLRQRINAARRQELRERTGLGAYQMGYMRDGRGTNWPPLVFIPAFMVDRVRPSLEQYDSH